MAERNSGNINTDSNAAVLETNAPTKARHIAKCGVLTIRKDRSVYEAVAMMVRENVSGLPVVDNTGLVGIVSEKDLLGLLYGTEYLQGTIENHMTRDVVTFDEDDELTNICNCLASNNFRRVPILHEGDLAGIISRADIIKTCSGRFRSQVTDEELTDRRVGPLASDIMKRGLLTVTKQTPIYEAMEMVAATNVTGLPVVDNYMNLVGIVSEKDMLKLLIDPDARLGNTEDFMTQEVVSFNHGDSLFDICDCLINNNFRRVPILNRGKVVGVISRADLMVYILKNKSAIFGRRRTDLAV